MVCPDTTCTTQGWALQFDGACRARVRTCSITSRGTGVGLKARIERRVLTASSSDIEAAVWGADMGNSSLKVRVLSRFSGFGRTEGYQ